MICRTWPSGPMRRPFLWTNATAAQGTSWFGCTCQPSSPTTPTSPTPAIGQTKACKNIAMKLKTWTVDLTRGAFKSVCELDTSCLRTHKLALCILNFLANYHLVLLDCCSIWYCPLVRRALVEAIYFFFTWILKRSWRFQLFVPCRSFEATVRPKRTNSFDEWLSYTLV